MFIVVYDGLANLYSIFVILVLTDIPTFLICRFFQARFKLDPNSLQTRFGFHSNSLQIFSKNWQRIFKTDFSIYQNTLHFPNSKTFFK